MNNKKFYDIFAKRLKEEYGAKISVGVEFEPEEESYKLWHNYENFDDIEFKRFIGRCIKEIFYANEIYDFYITYENRYEYTISSLFENISFDLEQATIKISDNNIKSYKINTNSVLSTAFECYADKVLLGTVEPNEYIKKSNVYWEGGQAA